MKIIHLADLHIGSKFDHFPEDIKSDLNSKLRNAFLEIIKYANTNKIDTIIMSGDIFDKNTVLIKDKKFFYDSIKSYPDIDFYYIRGNHDLSSKYEENILNLHTFDGISSYTKKNVRIIGYELSDNNDVLYNYSPFTSDKFNIMMLHGDINNSRDNNYIDLKRLEDKNIDYFALGHIHKRSDGMINNSKYAYPGCVMGRGFDELGKKGFLVLDTEKNDTEFINIPSNEFENVEINITNKNEVEIKNLISQFLKEKNSNITEIKLIGKTDLEIDTIDLNNTFKDYRYYLIIKNESKLKLNYSINEKENSLKNMFINKVLENKDLDEETKELVINYGLSKLIKEEE